MSAEGHTNHPVETIDPQVSEEEVEKCSPSLPASHKTPSGEDDAASKKKLLRTLSRKGTENLKELVRCSICLDRLSIPKMLPCQHTFCLLCIQNCIVGSGEAARLRCAQCRSEITFPKEGVSTLPGNIYLQSILDLLDSDYAAFDEFVRCAFCQTICDVSVCEHCSNAFCSLCLDRHVDDLKKQLGQISEQLQEVTDRLQQREKSFQESLLKLKEEIHEAADKRIKKILDIETRLLRNVDQVMINEDTRWRESVKKLDNTAQNIQEIVNKKFDEASTSSEKVSIFLGLHRESSDLITDVSSSCQTRMSFDPQSFNLVTVRKESYEEGEESESNVSIPHSCPSGGIAKNEENPKIKDWAEAHSRLYRSKSFVPKMRIGTSHLQRPSGIAASPWSNELFVVSMDNHRVLVFDINSGKYLRFFGTRGQKPGEFLCPFGIALSQTEQTILVTDKWKHCIHVFNKDGRFQKQIGMKGRSPGHFRSPESISVDHNGKIYVCDTCNDRIQVFDKEGAFVCEMGVKSLTEGGSVRQRSMFHEPTGIAVTPDGQRVVVSDFGNHRIHVFSSNGDLLFTFGQKGTQRGQFIRPECVAVDSKGFIFVGDSGNGRVQICRPDGRFIRSFGSKGCHSGQFSWISGIAILNNYDIVVTDFKNHCVQIF
ncbi:uncharacterized protein LOC143252517 [Tachypleus tridentatus]|uniref:uncharacterized protein LOC143252517 n=1 Tax=Tachypleus tridentatus TaxID=6853 RepID=UPI003FD41031